VKAALKAISWAVALASAGVCCYLLYLLGFSGYADRERLEAFIASYGPAAPAAYFAVQFAQVLFAPIPGNVTGLVGGALFGIAYGSALGIGAMALGSTLLFCLGHRYGIRLAEKLFGAEKAEKYARALSTEKAKAALLWIFLLPFLPDDMVCLVAGAMKLRIRTFLAILIAGRAPSVVITSCVGAGIAGGELKAGLAAAAAYYTAVMIALRFAAKTAKN